MTYSGGALYLYAEDLATKSMKTFALSRMKDAEMLGDEEYNASKVTYQEAFGQEIGLVRGKGSVQKLVFIFKPGGAATFVRERIWHPTQKLTPQGDGSLHMELNIAISSWLIKWILGFEDSVEILEPASLRDQVASAAEAIVRVYRKGRAA